MRYICTLLKDLPDYSAGLKFMTDDKCSFAIKLPEDIPFGKSVYPYYDIPRKVIDNPDWVKKELDETCLTELKCKKCGNTKLFLQVYNVPSKYVDGVRYYKMGVRGICTCGCENKFITFTTHSEVERW